MDAAALFPWAFYYSISLRTCRILPAWIIATTGKAADFVRK